MPRKAIPHSAPVRAKGKPAQAGPDPQALEDEIHMLRKLMRRAQQAAEQVDLDDVQSMARLLNALSSAAARLAISARSAATSAGMKNEAAIWNTKHRAQAPTLIQRMAVPSEERIAIRPASRGARAAPI